MNTQETACGWLYLALELFVLPSVLQQLNSLLPAPLSQMWMNTVFYLLNFLFVLVIFHSFLSRSLTAVGKKFGQFLKGTVLGFVGYWVCGQVLGWLLGLVPEFVNVNDRALSEMVSSNFAVMLVGTVFLVPVVEEIFYRGLIFQGLYNRNRELAYLLSVLVFSAVHVVGYLGSASPLVLLLCFLQYIPAGLFLALAYVEADTIFAPIVIHMVINAMGIFSLR